MTSDDTLVEALSRLEIQSTLLNSADRTLLSYAIKLTQNPSSITTKDVGLLASEGFDDRAIHDLCQVVAYFNYVNRIADGLGVGLEDRFTHGRKKSTGS